MNKACDDIKAALSAFEVCTETDEGSRVTTHCLYPSFDPVNVFVVRFGDGFRVHDGGGAVRSAWTHGREDSLVITDANEAGIEISNQSFGRCPVADVPSIDWLASAILAVANASAAAAHAALDRFVTATETVLKDKILRSLKSTVPPSMIAVDYEVAGQSKRHKFDFAVTEFDGSMLLLNAIAPHHISVSSKYVAFSDIIHREGIRTDRWAVHDKELEPSFSADVEYRDITSEGLLRQSSFKGLKRRPMRFTD
jgi:hypothetical protein